MVPLGNNQDSESKYEKTEKTPRGPSVHYPSISVILATKGTKIEMLEKCIKSLLRQTFRDFEILLIYRTYPEPLSKLILDNNIVTLKENFPSLGAARNLGVRNSKGYLVSFIDDDAEAPDSWLHNIQATLERYPSLSCLGGPHLTPQDECRGNPQSFLEGTFLESHMQKAYVDKSAIGKIAGCNVTYRKSVFEELGYLNEKLKTCEDWEFHKRLVLYGYRLRFDPNITVLHHRQGLRHLFQNNSNVAPFYLSWRTLKLAKYESLFAAFYLSNLAVFILLGSLFLSLQIFGLLAVTLLIAYCTFTAIRTRTYSWRVIYFPLAAVLTLVRLAGFYYGIGKILAGKLKPKGKISKEPLGTKVLS